MVNKIFIRKTRQGKILKLVRENYLRDDISCLSDLCTSCNQANTIQLNRLDKLPVTSSKLCDFPHYIVFSSDVILNQIDVVESELWKNCIIPLTVHQEVRSKSLAIYHRLKDIMNIPNRKFVLFVNEHHKDTYIERKPGESASAYASRCVLTTCNWYQTHLAELQQQQQQNSKIVKLVYLCNDDENKEAAVKEGLLAYTIAEYVKSLQNHEELVDKLSKVRVDKGDKVGHLFQEHLSQLQLLSGLKTKRFLQGVFYTNTDNYQEGTVNVEGSDKQVLIPNLLLRNRAVSGDVVAIELLQEGDWVCPSKLVCLDDKPDPGDVLLIEETQLPKLQRDPETVQPTGRVVGILRRKWKQYCGTLEPSKHLNEVNHLFIPSDRRIPKIRIETHQAGKLIGQRIYVGVDDWPRYSRYPLGHFVRMLGPLGDKATETEVLLLEHDVPHNTFPIAVLACLPVMPWTISPDEEKKRTDLRHIDVCSVDPPGCTDIDDALHCRELQNGNYEVGVHIADVSYFVRPMSALDREAARRGTTVYLSDQRIDMVPELLSSNLCSLREHEDRLAFSCLWEVTPNGKMLSTRFVKSIIRSRSAFTYAEAQAKIDDESQTDALAQSLRRLLKLSKIMKKARTDRGALTLASAEIRFKLDIETQDPISVVNKSMLDTNSMVEEWMLAANIAAAEKTRKDFPEVAMLRRHPEPPQSNFEPLLQVAKTKGFNVNTRNGKELSDSLEQAQIKDNPYANTLLRMITTRCMMQAVYFCSGTLPENLFLHYGLAAPIYTHFTSPIRRYADIVVHRLLAASIGADTTYQQLLDRKATSILARQLNFRHRMAQYAGRASVALHTNIFFRRRVDDEEAYIIFVKENALTVFLSKYGLEGVIVLPKPPEEPGFVYDSSVPLQKCGNVEFRPLDKILVRISLEKSSIQHEQLVLRLVEPKIEGFSIPSREEDELMEKGKRRSDDAEKEKNKRKK
ncbi:exosome complex exonuclease RRP44-like [Artemia franciscana]|uniref:Protein DIS3 homolog n=1 Tax=Artemia franciscana TaxID=6661 RepID=A0AA88HIS8_ARTSF|nr:hypothetical protein QYM36_016201 [Artemia franciscana]KAK2706098.1 hypothetical protein QYM36_016201 [Artemia franciscana]